MPTSYPASNDSFSEPSSPTSTPLSSSGDGTRNHWQHHRDLGDAVEAIEANAALGSHNHDGTGDRPTSKLLQANTHQSPDTDSALTALHHTIGTGTNQAINLPLAKTNLDPRYVRKDGAVDEAVTGVKTLDRPVIADLSNAKHNHSSNATGGVSVNNSIQNGYSVGVVIAPVTTIFIRHPNVFNVPAGVDLTGMVVVDFNLGRVLLQEVIFQAYLGPYTTAAPDVVSSSAPNLHDVSTFRWPGVPQINGGDQNAFEIIRTQLVIPFLFAGTGSAKLNQSVFVKCSVGSGGSFAQWNSSKLSASLSVSF